VIQHREVPLRRVAFLVGLAVRLDLDDDERVKLTQRAGRIALENVYFPLEMAHAKASQWKSLPIDEIRDLRYLKNLFRPLKALIEVEKETIQSREILAG